MLGNGENGSTGYLTSNACTKFYLQIDLEPEDPYIFSNNFPLKNTQIPTNVTLSSFSAVVEKGAVKISWTSETEPDITGFNIYRSAEECCGYAKVNESMIVSQGNATTGASYSYLDKPEHTGNYYYKLQAVSLTGDTSFHGPISVILTKINRQKNRIPMEYSLSQNYPNPFNPETNIEYGLPKAEVVVISIYDINGKLVRNLVAERKSAGNHSVTWDARDNNGIRVVSGLYFYFFKAGDYSQTLKMILMK